MDIIIESVVVGTTICILAIVIGKIWEMVEKRQAERKRINESRTGPLFIHAANAVSDLRPLVRSLGDLHGGNMEIVGGDGRYIVRKSKDELESAIREWIAAGMNVKYVLTNASNEVQDKFRILIHDFGEDHLQVWVRNGRKVPEEALGLFEKLRTFHPTLISLPRERKAMWLEGLHRDDSSVAYDVIFVSPEVMAANDAYQTKFMNYKGEIETITNFCDRLSAASGDDHRAIA